MMSIELQEVKDHWAKKYPNVDVVLHSLSESEGYCGKIMTHKNSFNLQGATIGELISQGEDVLRMIK